MSTQIEQNTDSLRKLLQMANNLPDAGGDPVETVEQATPTISVDSNGKITATSEQAEGYVEAGTKTATTQLDTQAAQTITPGTSNQTIPSGLYLTGTQTIKGDANLVASNIKKGVSIFNVLGTLAASGGASNMATGTITLASTTNAEVEVTHNLGVTPNIVIWVLEDKADDAAVANMSVYGLSVHKSIKYSNASETVYPMYNFFVGWNASSLWGNSQNNTDITDAWNATKCTLAYKSPYRFQAGYTYRWIACAFDSVI